MNEIVRKPKERKILDAALVLLREDGDRALTMRALASKTDMSLSNVQYYFKDKDTLLAALVEDYFDICAGQIAQMARSNEDSKQEDRIRHFLTHVFSEGQELSDMCAVFRELWAIATRNQHIAEALQQYYQRLADILCRDVFSDVEDERMLADITLLIIPYVEGYSVAGRALHADVDVAVSLIDRMVTQLKHGAPDRR